MSESETKNPGGGIEKGKQGNSSEESKPKSLLLKKSQSWALPSKPAYDLPMAEQMNRFLNEVPSRFHSLPKKPSMLQTTASRKMPSTLAPMPSSSTVKNDEEKENLADSDLQVSPHQNLRKASSFTDSHASAIVKPGCRVLSSCPDLPPAPTRGSMVYEDRNGKIKQKLVDVHVGVPQSGCSGLRKVDVKPFSFVEREEKARKLREERLKKAFEESVNFPKFKANPLPSYLSDKNNKQ